MEAETKQNNIKNQIQMNTKLLIYLLIMIESGGDDRAIGDNGIAVGCLQIHPILVEDVNRITGLKYTLEDRYNRSKSIEMFYYYITHYATKERIGRDPTAMDIARIWNGGGNGYKKQSTIKYWNKVIKLYEELI
jgi:hypothetical protein